MSTLLLSLPRENPMPGFAMASLNLIVALSLVGLSLLLVIAISLLAWMHSLADRGFAALTPHRDCLKTHRSHFATRSKPL